MSLLDLKVEDRQSLAMFLPALIIFAGELIEKAGDHLIFGPFGLNVPKYGVLSVLSQMKRPLSMTELRDATSIRRSASNMTQIVDSLEQMGLVRRVLSSADRRVWLAEITPDGLELMTRVNDHYQQQMLDYLRDFKQEDLETTVVTLRRFVMDTAAGLGINLAEREHKPDHPHPTTNSNL